jgi:hypothetical protein
MDMIGFLSEKMAKIYGTSIYQTLDGSTVEVSAVYPDKEIASKMMLWDDAECVGPVTAWKSVGRKRPNPFEKVKESL